MDENIDKIGQKNKTFFRTWFLGLFIFFILIIFYLVSSPFGNENIIIHISSGQSVNAVSQELKDKNAIRNKFILRGFVKLLKSGNGIVSGDYLIKKNSLVWNVAWQIGRGHHNIEPIKITIREGLNNEQIAILLEDKLSGFRKDLFLSEIKGKQGYLFPDTYFFYPLDTRDEIIKRLSNNFDKKTKNIKQSVNKSGKDFKNIIIMASILEGEASGKEDNKIISGILWKRISLSMPLQVDIDKNTYTKRGLPEEPLNNPGLSSIDAAFNPIDSPYLYYLHDKNGFVHFAKTFEEHKKNINNYLK